MQIDEVAGMTLRQDPRSTRGKEELKTEKGDKLTDDQARSLGLKEDVKQVMRRTQY